MFRDAFPVSNFRAARRPSLARVARAIHCGIILEIKKLLRGEELVAFHVR